MGNKVLAWFLPFQTGIEKGYIVYDEPCTCGCVEFDEIREDNKWAFPEYQETGIEPEIKPAQE